MEPVEVASEDNEHSSSRSKLIKTSNNPIEGKISADTIKDSNIISSHHNYSTNSNWQSEHKSVMDRVKFLLFNKALSDITFIVGEEKEPILAHKFILSMSSTVFEAMFYSMLATQSCEVEIPDIEPVVFRNLLTFLYTDEVAIDHDTVMTILYTAKKYAVMSLEEKCAAFLEHSLNFDNAFLLLSQARLFDVKNVITKCLDTIDRNTQLCIASESFIDIDNDTLELLLSRNTLRIKEIDLYKAVIRWATAECERNNIPMNPENQRAVLKKNVKLIRYPLMTSQEFASGPAQDGLLTDREKVQLFLYFNLNPKPTCEFSMKPRCCLTGREAVCDRFLQVDTRWGYSGASDRIRFQVDQRIFIAGFGLYGSLHSSSEYTVDIELIYVAANTKVASNKTKFVADGSAWPFRVYFKEPVEIIPYVSYCAVATIKGSDSYYGTKGLRKVTVAYENDFNSINVTFQFSYANGNNNGTSVEDGQIPEIIFYA